jgi:hypothetical protein
VIYGRRCNATARDTADRTGRHAPPLASQELTNTGSVRFNPVLRPIYDVMSHWLARREPIGERPRQRVKVSAVAIERR